jgi:hypothetical protein
MTITPEKPRRRPGRPTKQEEIRRALSAAGCDPAAIDPLRILAGIAADETKPPTARVAACKALIAARSAPPDLVDGLAVVTNGVLGDRAIRLLAATRRGH